ncbi:MAG: YjjG family noncanonical pyrimidine nucleotidase [Mangrovibacterium sp.]
MINTQHKYKHLFFDLDHTLWDFKTNSAESMRCCLEQLQILNQLPSFEIFFDFYEQVNDRLWEEYRQGITSKAELSERRFSEPFTHFEITHVKAEDANELYLKFMGEQKKLFPGCVHMLDMLREQGYLLHIISNGFIEVQMRKLQSAGIDSYFQSVTLSEMVGSPKPKPAVFEYALKNSNARKTQSIMIGDDWKNDVLGAINFGMDTILFQESKPDYPEIIQACQETGYLSLELKFTKKISCFHAEKLADIPTILACC